METEDITEVINMQPTTNFLSGEELVNLRKPEELAPQLNVGLKFSECKQTEAEKEAVDCALDSQKIVLSQKRGARICDLMQAEWNEELNVSIATKLKGKFVQHMGHKMDDKIALTSEESLFLLENGCLEVMNGKAPMSTEEAYAAMLKQKLSIEKYIVYSYLSQLGFIVIPHQKEVKNKSQSNVTAAERNKKKRKVQSPLTDDSRNKRLTFSGAFSEQTEGDKVLEATKSLLSDIAIISKGSPSAETDQVVPEECKKSDADINDGSQSCHSEITSTLTRNTVESANTGASVSPEECKTSDVDDKLQSNHLEIASPPCNTMASVEIDMDVNEVSSVEPSLSASVANVDVDSQSTDVLYDSLEKSAVVFVTTNEQADIDVTTQSSDSQCAVINNTSEIDEQNSDILSCSSYDYNELTNNSEENSEENLIMDDEITLVEITKKETTPLAVIDLLSDEEEMQPAQNDSESDDDIKILEVCNGSSNTKKTSTTPVNLGKIKMQKIEICKPESSSAHTIQNTSARIQFPELFRKDLVCVARPDANLLPLHVLPGKEVYILDCSKLQQTNRGSSQSAGAPQSQGRLWNSFKDMQDYQRSVHRNRQFPRHQNQERSWQRGSYRHEDGPYSRPSLHNNFGSSREWSNNRSDRNSPNIRQSDMNRRDQNSTRNQQVGDYPIHNGSEDRKPFVSNRTPDLLANYPRSNHGDSFPLRLPQLTNPNSLPLLNLPPKFPPLGDPPPVPHLPPSGIVPSLTSQEYVAEVHRTAYSYATTMLSSMFGPSFVANNSRFPPPLGMPQPITLIDGQNSTNLSNPFANEYYPLPNSRQLRGEFPRNRKHHTTEPFPCHFPNLHNTKSWNEVKATVEKDKEQFEDDSSDIEEIPISLNEFLWNASNIRPLVKPGIKHPLADVLSPLKLTQLAKLTDKACRNDKYFSDNQALEISFDVYKPGVHFKKSCPGIPNLRIIVMRASDPVPRYSEIAFLKRKWSDAASLQIAIVDNADVSFYSFSSVCIPDIEPFQD